MGKCGHKILPQTGGKEKNTVESGRKRTKEEKNREVMVERKGEQQKQARHGSPGKTNLGPPKPT